MKKSVQNRSQGDGKGAGCFAEWEPPDVWDRRPDTSLTETTLLVSHICCQDERRQREEQKPGSAPEVMSFCLGPTALQQWSYSASPSLSFLIKQVRLHLFSTGLAAVPVKSLPSALRAH